MALRAFVQAIHLAEPESAMNWAGEISSPGARARVVEDQYSQWEARDPEAARAWKERQ
jgi:hypothetical protein